MIITLVIMVNLYATYAIDYFSLLPLSPDQIVNYRDTQLMLDPWNNPAHESKV